MNINKHTKLYYLIFLLSPSLTLLTNPIKLHPAILQSLKRAALNRYTSRRLSQSSSHMDKDNEIEKLNKESEVHLANISIIEENGYYDLARVMKRIHYHLQIIPLYFKQYPQTERKEITYAFLSSKTRMDDWYEANLEFLQLITDYKKMGLLSEAKEIIAIKHFEKDIENFRKYIFQDE